MMTNDIATTAKDGIAKVFRDRRARIGLIAALAFLAATFCWLSVNIEGKDCEYVVRMEGLPSDKEVVEPAIICVYTGGRYADGRSNWHLEQESELYTKLRPGEDVRVSLSAEYVERLVVQGPVFSDGSTYYVYYGGPLWGNAVGSVTTVERPRGLLGYFAKEAVVDFSEYEADPLSKWSLSIMIENHLAEAQNSYDLCVEYDYPSRDVDSAREDLEYYQGPKSELDAIAEDDADGLLEFYHLYCDGVTP